MSNACNSLRKLTLNLLVAAVALGVSTPALASLPSHCSPKNGGTEGAEFFTGWTINSFLAQIVVWHGPGGGWGDVINGIEPVWCFRRTNDQVSCEVDQIGRMVGTRSSFSINWQAGERLTFVQGRSGRFLDAIQFRTNWGNWSGWFGGQGGNFFSDTAEFGRFINDFWGQAGGDLVIALGACHHNPQ